MFIDGRHVSLSESRINTDSAREGDSVLPFAPEGRHVYSSATQILKAPEGRHVYRRSAHVSFV